MGRKRSRTGKYFFCILAGLIFAGLAGCATVQQTFVDFETYTLFKESHLLMGMGEFGAAAARNQEVLAEDGAKPPADTALYNLGLIYAHQDNPGRDYLVALDYFKKLAEQFPSSQFSEEAQAWISILGTVRDCWQRQPEVIHEKSGKETGGQIDFEAALAADLKLLKRGGDQLSADVLYRLGLLYAHYENPKKDYKKAAFFMQRLVDEYPDSLLAGEARIWLGVFDAIQQLQQVDIDIEEKKKELSQ